MARFLSALSHQVALGVRRPGGGREGRREGGGASKQPGGDREEVGGAQHTLLEKWWGEETPPCISWEWGLRVMQQPPHPEHPRGCHCPQSHARPQDKPGGHQKLTRMVAGPSFWVCGEMAGARTPQSEAARPCQGLWVRFLLSQGVALPF